MKPKRRGTVFFGVTSRALMLAAAFLLALSYLSIFVNPANAWFMAVFGLLFAPIALLNLLLLVWALFRRSKAAMIPFCALLPSMLLLGRIVQFGGKEEENESEGVSVLSYNVGRFASASDASGIKDRGACADSVFTLLKKLDPDIICLQEFYLKDVRKVGSYLARKFKGYEIEYYVYPYSDGCYGNVTLSRYPIVSKSKLDFEDSSNLAISCDVDIDGTMLRIYNCHFQSYSLSLPYLAEKIRGDYREAVRYTEDKMRKSIRLRPEQVDLVMENIESSPVKAVVVGDFNDGPVSYTYQRLSKGRKDSFCEAGSGMGATYSAFRPLFRIDYILYPEQFTAVSHRILQRPYSDHYPLLAKIKQ